jgi:hypothetical protein
MVKNTIGGSKSRGFARKSYNKPSSVVRIPTNPFEQIAIVTKVSGGGRCIIITSDSLSLNCVIRNKFKARFKSMNLISIHSIILIGLREWETPDFKICDLLEVYSQDDISHLRQLPAFSNIISRLDTHNDTHTPHTPHTHLFEFTNEHNIIHNDDTHTHNTHNNTHNNDNYTSDDFKDIIDDI